MLHTILTREQLYNTAEALPNEGLIDTNGRATISLDDLVACITPPPSSEQIEKISKYYQ